MIMKTRLLVLAFCLGLLNCYAQNSGFTAYRSKDYQTAIKLYKADLAKQESIYERFMLATCYEKVDSIAQAKRNYEIVANTKERNFQTNSLGSEACEKLTAFFLKEKQYQQALRYIQLTKA